MDDIELSLKADAPEDYSVLWITERFGKWRIGRIRFASELSSRDKWTWVINLPVPIPSSCQGRASSLEEAQAAFRRAWEVFLPTLTARQLQHAFDVHQGAGRRVP